MTMIVVGLVLVVVGVFCYTWAARDGWDDLRSRPWLGKIADIVSHLPRDVTPAWPHVLGGVTFFSGASLALAGSVAHAFALGRHYAMEFAGFLFAAAIAVISFYTLWQTRRIDLRIGTEIETFRALVEKLTRDARKLYDASFDGNGTFTNAQLRFLLVTKNPLFGQLTFPGEKITEDFKNALVELATRVPQGVSLGIVCADEPTLTAFHEQYFKDKGASAATKTENANSETTAFLDEITRKAGRCVIRRVTDVPPIQFAVIGNRTYEFFLETTDGSTDIQRSQQIDEGRTARRFAEFFEQLSKQGAEHAVVAGISEDRGNPGS